MDYQKLIEEALLAREAAYAPYSGFQVGAALLCKDGGIYRGYNIENAAYTPSNCAERTAFFKAVSDGCRDFVAIAVVGGNRSMGVTDFAYPCGVCRQVMVEFCDPAAFQVVTAISLNEYQVMTLQDLLPKHFGPHNV